MSRARVQIPASPRKKSPASEEMRDFSLYQNAGESFAGTAPPLEGEQGDPGCRQGRRNAPARKERGIWRASRRKRPVFEEGLRTFQNSPQA